VINGAATFVGIEESANLTEMLVLFAAHRIFFVRIPLCEFGASLGEAQAKILREPFDITLGQRDDRIGTAITRTFGTVIHQCGNDDLIRSQS
jgi:hypothetical protein